MAAALLRHIKAMERGTGLTTLLLVGPHGAGKTRLLTELLLSEPQVDFEVLDIDQTSPLETFAEINRSAAARRCLILEGRGQPSRWFDQHRQEVPPDLRSRLAAAPVVRLSAPPLKALVSVLKAEVALHGQRVPSGKELEEVAYTLPPDFGAPRRFCQALDRAEKGLNRRDLLRWAAESAHVRPAEQIEGN